MGCAVVLLEFVVVCCFGWYWVEGDVTQSISCPAAVLSRATIIDAVN